MSDRRILGIERISNERLERSRTAEEAKSQLEAKLANLQGESDTLTKEVDRLRSELDQALTRISAPKRSEPSDRDRALFARVISEWPWNEGTLWWLEAGFDAKQWRSEHATQVVIYADQERETFFDDPDTEVAFTDFKEACQEMSNWLIGKSFPHRHHSGLQEIPDGSEREEGWPAFDAERAVGLSLAHEVIDSRRKLERVGRAQGL